MFDPFNQLKIIGQPTSNGFEMNNLVGHVPVPYIPCKNWATISYYELNTRIGEQIKVSSNTVSICVVIGIQYF